MVLGQDLGEQLGGVRRRAAKRGVHGLRIGATYNLEI